MRASFDERLKKTINDPTKQDRVRKEMAAEVERVKTKVIKFDGKKTGYDVSIVDQEFLHDTSESMLVAKEELNTRYFFFTGDRLYKMFLAFDKEMLQGKSFRDFGQLMQARFGKAREVNVEEKTKAGVKVKLDHFIWGAKSGRHVAPGGSLGVLRRVLSGDLRRQGGEPSRTRFASSAPAPSARTTWSNRSPPSRPTIAIPTTTCSIRSRARRSSSRAKSRAADIVVPSPTPSVRAPTPAEVNRRGAAEKSDKRSRKDDDKERTTRPKPAGKPGDETKGLAL